MTETDHREHALNVSPNQLLEEYRRLFSETHEELVVQRIRVRQLDRELSDAKSELYSLREERRAIYNAENRPEPSRPEPSRPEPSRPEPPPAAQNRDEEREAVTEEMQAEAVRQRLREGGIRIN